MFELPARLLALFYSFTSSYALAISLIAVVVMLLVTPLTLKSTKGMLEMQRLAPEMRKLQSQYRNDRQKLNEEMMKLYQEHKVNPMASCLPLLAQTPVFIIMFRVLHDLTYVPTGGNALMAQAVLNAGGDTDPIGFLPRYLSADTSMYQSLVRQTEMNSLGLDLSKSTATALGESFGTGLIYALIVVVLAGLYFFQQRMVAARASVSPTMSPTQQKLMQYLPVFFAVFQIFFLLGLVIYYIVQAILRILQQAYITRRFYGHEDSLGRQAQRAGEHARELAKEDGGGGGLFASVKRDAAATASTKDGAKESGKDGGGKGAGKQATPPPKAAAPGSNKRTTAPKNRPTPSAGGPTGRASTNRPSSSRPGGERTKKR
jgi:YidC/Oxa1 family membrane protein insertase